MEKLQAVKQRTLDIILLLILAVIPLIHSTHFYNSFRLLKTTVFITLVSIALIIAVWMFIKKNFSFWKKYKWLLVILGGLFIIKIISFLFSINHYISFWGGYSKLEGLLTWSMYFIFFLILCFNFINKKKRKKFIFIITFSLFAITIFGLLQHYGIIGKQWSGSVIERPIASLGNPLHLGALMMFSIPISLYAIYLFKSYTLKIFAAIALFCEFLILLFTQSRSSWATFAIVVIITTFLFLLKKSKNKKWLIIFSIIAVLFVSSFTYIGIAKPDLVSSQYLTRATSIFDTEDLSNKQRLYFWKGSWTAFTAKPLFGWGEDNLNIAFDRSFPPKLADLPETRIDRAHNVFLDILVEEGIFSFLLFMAFLGYLFYLSIKLFFNKKDTEKNWIGFLGIWFVIGYCLQYFFMYPVISAYVVIFFVFSQVAYCALVNQQEVYEKKPKQISSFKQLLIVVPLIAIFFLILFLGTIPRISANWVYTIGLKNPQLLEQNLEKAYAKWQSPHYRVRLASHYMDKAFAFSESKPAVAEDSFKKSQGLFLKDINIFPDNYVSYLNVGSIYNVFGMFEPADNYFNQAALLAPTRQDVYWAWAENMAVRNDIDAAISIYKKAIKVDPEVAMSYYKLSLFYKRHGKDNEAEQYLQLAIEHGLLPMFIKKEAPMPQVQVQPQPAATKDVQPATSEVISE